MTASPTLPPSFLRLPLAHRGLHDRAAHTLVVRDDRLAALDR